MMRGKFDLLDFDPHIPPLSKELELGKFTVLVSSTLKFILQECSWVWKKRKPCIRVTNG